jgi:uncharacterized protein
MSHILAVLEYVVESFIHIWPYLLITIPIAVAVQMSGVAQHITHAFSARPLIAILLATAVGAFSPLCSCSVIPVVAAMLIGGVPLAPVMSFWLASPSMDPEIFFLTVSSLGWNLAVWRLAATLILSLSGGFVTHFIVQHGWLGQNILRQKRSTEAKTLSQVFMTGVRTLRERLSPAAQSVPVAVSGCCDTSPAPTMTFATAGVNSESLTVSMVNSAPACADTCTIETPESSFWRRLANETWTATMMVIKFMVLAWIIGAVVKLYIPQELITRVLSGDNPFLILTAAFLGIPVYTSNLAAMPLVGGLLDLGMHPGAALAFLIAGPITTLPAMSAVWGLVNRKVFAIYIGFALVGAVLLGYAYSITMHF